MNNLKNTKSNSAQKRKLMLAALKEAIEGVKSGDGGPFGALIARNGKILSKAHNMVIALNDPTAHAEILAIRKACQKLKSFSLHNCEIFSTCEPCPMCLSAIHWARINKIYYACTRQDAEKIGFDDKLLYDMLKGKNKAKFKLKRILREKCLSSFELWNRKKDKISY